MGHLFVLFPAIIGLGIWMHRAYQKSADRSRTMRSFRNFFFTWAICSAIMGALAVFIGSTLAIGLSLAFGIPFIYFAGATLMFLPFLLYNRNLGTAKLLATIIALWGILVGVIIYTNATGIVGNLGVIGSFFIHVFSNIKFYHLFGVTIVFVPIGIFFLMEAAKSVSAVSRIQAVLIGSGIIVAGVAEGFHAWILNPTGFDFPDYVVPLAFLLISVGILYPRITGKTI